jgi:hypothetical protein
LLNPLRFDPESTDYVERAERAYERMVAAWMEKPPTAAAEAKSRAG